MTLISLKIVRIFENDITRSSTGVVLEWQSGFGPINLVFAWPIDDEAGDRNSGI